MQISNEQKRISQIIAISLSILLILGLIYWLTIYQFGVIGHFLFIIGLFITIKNIIRLFVFPGSFWLWRRNVENRYAKALAKRAHKRMEDLSILINQLLQTNDNKYVTADDLIPIKKTLQSFTTTFSAMDYKKELNPQQLNLFNLCQQLEQNLKELIINQKSLFDYLDKPNELLELTKQTQQLDIQISASILNYLMELMNQLEEIYSEKNIILTSERWIFNKTLGTIDQMRVELENTFKTKRYKVQSFDGKLIDCLFLQANEEDLDENGTTVIFCQPNAGYYEYMYYESEWIDYYIRRGINMFLWNYRGYCESEGLPNTQDILKDAENVYDFVQTQLKVTKIIVHGESLGGMVACHLGNTRQCNLLFADRTFQSLSKVAEVGFSKYAGIIFNLITPWDYDSAKAFIGCQSYKIVALDCKDEVIPLLSSLKVELSKQVYISEFGQFANEEFFKQTDQKESFFTKLLSFIPGIKKDNQLLFQELWYSQILTKQEMITFFDANKRIQIIMKELQTERNKKTLDDSYSTYLNDQQTTQENEQKQAQNNQSNSIIEIDETTTFTGPYILQEQDKNSEELYKFLSQIYDIFELFESGSMTLNDIFVNYSENQQYQVFQDYLLTVFFWGSYLPLKNIPKKKMNIGICQKLAFARFTTNLTKLETLIKHYDKNNSQSPTFLRLAQDLELIVQRFKIARENFKKISRTKSQNHSFSSNQLNNNNENDEKKTVSKLNEYSKLLGSFIPLNCGHNGNLSQVEIDALDFHMQSALVLPQE